MYLISWIFPLRTLLQRIYTHFPYTTLFRSLDEATSALDTKAERQVQAGLDELMRDRTSLIIAHRLSTIAGVDRIITLAEGRIDEIGSPAELAASGGIYAQLLDLQTSGDTSKLARYDITG